MKQLVTASLTPVVRRLHWLPVRQCVDFKLAVYVCRELYNTTSQYLVEDCQLVSNAVGRRQLRSADVDTRIFRPVYIQERALVIGAFRLMARGCGTVYQWSCAIQTLK